MITRKTKNQENTQTRHNKSAEKVKTLEDRNEIHFKRMFNLEEVIA